MYCNKREFAGHREIRYSRDPVLIEITPHLDSTILVQGGVGEGRHRRRLPGARHRWRRPPTAWSTAAAAPMPPREPPQSAPSGFSSSKPSKRSKVHPRDPPEHPPVFLPRASCKVYPENLPERASTFPCVPHQSSQREMRSLLEIYLNIYLNIPIHQKYKSLPRAICDLACGLPMVTVLCNMRTKLSC